MQPVHGEMLALQLQRLQLIDQQMAELNRMIAQSMKSHQDAVIRLAEVPGLGLDSAQQIIAEVGAQASTFPSAAELTSWVGTCPGKEESAEHNHSSRSAKGNKYLRRVLNQAAHAAVAKKGSHFQVVFRRLLPRLGYQSAIWAVAHRLSRVVWKILETCPNAGATPSQARLPGHNHTHKPSCVNSYCPGLGEDFRRSANACSRQLRSRRKHNLLHALLYCVLMVMSKIASCRQCSLSPVLIASSHRCE